MEDGRERDGVYVTEDAVYLIEATIDRSLEKARKDGKKLAGLAKTLQQKYPDKAVKAYFITKEEPQAEQRSEVQKHGYLVAAISFSTFYSKLCDSWMYLSLREKYPFGSDVNPVTGTSKYDDGVVPIRMLDTNAPGESWDLDKLIRAFDSGERVTVIGQYGVGKSVCCKEVFKCLRARHQNGESLVFPVYVNLRDHHGQSDPAEVLERHATKLGYEKKHHLVRAWRAGFILPILDGFDETAALGWARLGKKLKQIRYQSVELVRAFLRETPTDVGVLCSGRNNYFDTVEEMMESLGVNKSKPILSMQDFSHEQVLAYFKLRSIQYSTLPSWFPTKPLLLGYLLTKGIIDDMGAVQNMAPSEGWDHLIDKICERESRIEVGMSASNIRELIECAASYARKHQSGLGPVFQTELELAFKSKFGYEADDRAFVLLQRLPGLGSQNQQDGSRYFVDYNLAQIAKTGDVRDYVRNPYGYQILSDPHNWFESLGTEGIEYLAHKLSDLDSGVLQEAVVQAVKNECHVLAADILLCMALRGDSWKRSDLVLHDVLLSNWELNGTSDWKDVVFRECTFKGLDAENKEGLENWPRFEECLVGVCTGYSTKTDLPPTKFSETEIDEFEDARVTTAKLLSMDLPTPVRVGLSILKKLYMQAGSGRNESALFRGLDHGELRYVEDVLELLKKEALAFRTKQRGEIVWLPAKDQTHFVKALVQNPTSDLRLIQNLKKLA